MFRPLNEGQAPDNTVAGDCADAVLHQADVDVAGFRVRPFEVLEDDEVSRLEASNAVCPEADPLHDHGDRSERRKG